MGYGRWILGYRRWAMGFSGEDEKGQGLRAEVEERR